MAYDSDKLLQRQRLCGKCKSFITYTRNEEGDFRCPLCEKPSIKPKSVRPALSAQKLIETIHKHQNDVGPEHPLYNSFEAALDRRMMTYPFDDADQAAGKVEANAESSEAPSEASADTVEGESESVGSDQAEKSEGDENSESGGEAAS